MLDIGLWKLSVAFQGTDREGYSREAPGTAEGDKRRAGCKRGNVIASDMGDSYVNSVEKCLEGFWLGDDHKINTELSAD